MFNGIKNFRLWVFVFPVLAAIVPYAPMIDGGFSGDDLTIQVWQLPAMDSIDDAFVSPRFADNSGYYFRPMVYLSYMAERAFTNLVTGQSPPPLGFEDNLDQSRAAVPHAVNVLLHASASFLVTFFALRLLGGRPGATLGAVGAGILFALHPMQSLVVCPITGLSDLLAANLTLLALLLGLEARTTQRPYHLALTFIAMLAAFLSKEEALSGIFLLPLALWVTEEERTGPKKPLTQYTAKGQALLTMAAFAGYLLMRGISGAMDAAAMAVPDQMSELANMTGAIGFYLRSLVLPWPVLLYTPETGGLLAGLAAIAVAAAISFLVFRWLPYSRKILIFCILAMLIALSPALPVSWTDVNETPVAGRYLYFPMAWVAMLFSVVISHSARSARGKVISVAVLAAMTAAGAAVAHGRTEVWQSAVSLWTDEVSRPELAKYARPWVSLGIAHQQTGNSKQARESFLESLEDGKISYDVDRAVALNNLGVLEMDEAKTLVSANDLQKALERLHKAIEWYESAVEETPEEWRYHANLGSALIKKIDIEFALSGMVDMEIIERAANQLDMALQISPGNQTVLAFIDEWKAVSLALPVHSK